MPMAGLQRSATTFRRSGSSGLVWDERFLASLDHIHEGDNVNNAEDAQPRDNNKPDVPQLRHSRSVGSIDMLKRDVEQGKKVVDLKNSSSQKEAKKKHVFHTAHVTPDEDPPSPRVSGCILCSIFRKTETKKPKKQPARR